MSVELEQSSDPGFAHRRPPPVDVDAPFRQSLADLSRQLAGRTPVDPPEFDPKLEFEVAPEPTEPARRRHVRPHLALLALALGVGLAAVIHALLNATMSDPSPAPPRVVSVVPPPPPEPAPAITAADLAPKRVTADPPPAPVTPVAAPAPEPPAAKGKLEAYEIMEVQTRLKSAGLNPGPLDGLAGGQTTSAIKQYEASKNLPQAGKLDRDLLKQLRQEPDPNQKK
jgi:hypothetical protein